MKYKKLKIIYFIIFIIVMVGTGCTKETTKDDNNILIQPDNGSDERQINENDILIKEHPLLENTPFYSATIENIKGKYSEKLAVSYSEEKLDGFLTYYTGDGIVYITTEDGGLYSVILTNDNYEFACGLKTGMSESEINKLNLSFNIYDKDEIGVDKKVSSYLLSYKKGPLSMFDFDSIYYYSAILNAEVDSDNEMDSFAGRCIGLIVFMKDGKSIAVSTDWPNAN
ncbi:hypothetical protein [Anaerocolumna sp. MB42-C2]|uniref:hypothetical protein n=1 Tax=Anaerocolumna sp. MB42-C2 TaxID=3070997 RepID=UPI0027E19C70|nr:hypothetical protein [Anaerocolumna sp. MB42-C2]WMJ86820.1 hypothetical protein RBU59_22705 [Anaerocolumna sp. MB42-C2]